MIATGIWPFGPLANRECSGFACYDGWTGAHLPGGDASQYHAE